MSLTSGSFFLLLFIVCILYFPSPLRLRKLILLASGLAFYALADLRALPVPVLCALLSYFAARSMEKLTGRGKKALLMAAILFHFALLALFKFSGELFGLFGKSAPSALILPVGISFFTFAICAYLIDVYRGKMPAEKNLLDYAVFVFFFPALLSGPIGCAREFLPQLKTRQRFKASAFKYGLFRFVWGMVQKMIIADTMAIAVSTAYGGEQVISAGMWIIMAPMFLIQLYFDFAGYSNMAIGTAAALGFSLTENFTAPFFTTSPRAFWKRWHISLTGWFREYLYFPLGGSRRGRYRTFLNILIVFAASGIWHGNGTTFLIWGLLNGLLQILDSLFTPAKLKIYEKLRISPKNRLVLFVEGLISFGLISLSFVFFRAESLSQVRFVFGQMAGVLVHGVGPLGFSALGISRFRLLVLAVYLVLGLCMDIFQRRGAPLHKIGESRLFYYPLMAFLIMSVALLGVYGEGFDPAGFIYVGF